MYMFLLGLGMSLFSYIPFFGGIYANDDCGFMAEGCIDAKPSGPDGILVKDPTGDVENAIPNVVKTFVNWTLSILGLIALIVFLRGGFQMLFSNGDESTYQNGWKTLRNGALGLIFIGLAALILRLIFFVVQKTATTAVG